MRVILIALLFLPVALGASAAEVLYLAPGLTPISDGSLDAEAPQDLNNSISLILPGSADLPTISFTREGDHADRIYGPLLIGMWTGPSPTLMGNVTAVVSDGSTILSSASVDISIDPEALPDPTSLIPPDPTNPEQAAAYVLAQALIATMKPPVLMDLGFIDANVSRDAPISVSFFLEGEPVALGAASLQYDGALTPSFLYVPFYEADPAPSSSSSSSAPASSSSSSGSSGSSSPSLGGSSSSSAGSSESKDTPSVGFLAAIGVAGAAMLFRRYKL
ncbi:MAG: hypothetical protein ACPHK8_07195 [Thermoplasmatota archaeon]